MKHTIFRFTDGWFTFDCIVFQDPNIIADQKPTSLASQEPIIVTDDVTEAHVES